MQFQKISILPPQKGLEFLGGVGVGGSVRTKHLKKCMKLNGNFQRGGGGGFLEKKSLCGEVWIFSGITTCICIRYLQTLCLLVVMVHCLTLIEELLLH